MDQRTHRLFPRIVIVVATALLASACGGDTDSSATAPTSETASVTTAENGDSTTTTEFDDSGVELTNEKPEDEPDDTSTTEEPGESVWEEAFPDVVLAIATLQDDGTWTVAATLSSPYDSPERYADAWRVIGPDGTEYGIRELGHDHASEQPFTRSQDGIEIPDEVTTVTIQGRDQVSGWGGATFDLELSR